MNNQGQVYYGIALNSDSLLLAILILSGFLCFAVIVSLMRIYKKAGKPQISVIIPIWSQIVMLQIIEKPLWYLILFFIPIVNIVILIQSYILLAKKFGKGVGFGIGMIFLPMIFIPLLSFYDYIGNEEKKEDVVYNPFNQTEMEQVMPSAPIDVVNENVVNNAPIIMSEEIVPSIPVENVENNVNNESFEKKEEIVSSIPIDENNINVVDSNLSVIPEANHVENVLETQEIVNDIVSPVEIIEPTLENENISSNPTVQDIQSILNNKSVNEPKNIAFGTVTPIISNEDKIDREEDVNFETLNSDNKINESFNELENNNESVMEMPEIASKTCPACGVSLSNDVKFCTSCGTQL